MILVSPLIARIGGVFSRLRHDPPEVTRPVAGRPSMFVLRSMRKHPEIFGGRFGNHSRTGGKVLITRRTSQSSKLLRGTVRRTTACPRRPQLGCDPAPLQKDDSTLRLAYSALELSPWAMAGSRCGEPGRPGRADVPAQAFSSIAAMYPVLPALLRRPLAVRSRLGPNVDGVAGRIQRSGYYIA